MSSGDDFDSNFEALTGNPPFPWQRALFEELVGGRFPSTCDIPTGLGKTSAIAAWLLALAHNARTPGAIEFPRRLVYVVSRRTVVDQATEEARRMRDALVERPELGKIARALQELAAEPAKAPVAISTLRGQLADNAEWRHDPARPAIVLGTVDMIGSRLLFSGYGCGFRSRPLHAGFLGQDTVLLHDEAHLEPAFQELLSAIHREQERSDELRRLRVVALTATTRGSTAGFGLTSADRKHVVVRRRLHAKKGVAFHRVVDEKKLVEKVIEVARTHAASGQAILVFLRKLDHVERVTAQLRKSGGVQLLTGTLRGHERDELAGADPIFARFTPQPLVEPRHGTVFLVCTSAGEVGVNISADHLVCDCTPFDSMTQRFGRVNRFGEGDARIDVVHCPISDVEDPFEKARERTLALLHELPARGDGRHDASPAALGDLPSTDRQHAFTPGPVILAATDIHFDAWALTSVRRKLPGRPPVADWLHGVATWEPAETRVAWREEVGLLSEDLRESCPPEDLLEDYPLKPHELLRDLRDRVLRHLRTVAARRSNATTWLVAEDGSVRVCSLGELVEARNVEDALAGATVLLPPEVGGLRAGFLDGAAEFEATGQYDVADLWSEADGTHCRQRVWDDTQPAPGMRLLRTIDIRPGIDDDIEEEDLPAGRRFWHWFVGPRAADDDGSRTARLPQLLQSHLGAAGDIARSLAAKALGPRSPEAAAVEMAARWHDRGKHRAIWQRSIRNRDYPARVLAKSGGSMRPLELSGYRHELGSLLDISTNADFRRLRPELQDLVLHLIAAHHGRARPHFPAEEVFDPDHSDEAVVAAVSEVPRRFARLQRRYGRWGLAYLESLVRAADALASQSHGGVGSGVDASTAEDAR